MMTQKKVLSSNLQQTLFENSSWIRLIEYLKQENTFMKNHLSEMMDHVHERESLALAEHFQNQFIIKDDVYDHIIHELRIQIAKLRDTIWGTHQPISADMKKNHLHIKEQVGKIQQEHLVLSADYNTYLNSIN
ncbi:MAG: hypothetical protein ACK4YD_05975 [Chitinophagia bacterium]|jgi:hypothetical protein